MTEEYEDLTGREVKWWNGETGIVIGYDYDIGITIVNKKNPNDYMLCGNGRLSPIKKGPYNDDRYKAMFNLVTKLIKRGEFTHLDFLCGLRVSKSHPNSSTCPFGQ